MGNVTNPPDQIQVYCSDLSLEAAEPLYGSAAQTQAYLLLEYGGNWGAKALEESALPGPVKDRLNDLGKSIPGLKTLLIKTQRRQRLAGGGRFFIAALSVHSPRLHAFQLADYGDLLDLDIPAILAGDPAYDDHRWHEPLYLVCAHGRRDLCCALRGLPAYNALSTALQSSPELSVWQASHVGGHRFAANLLCLPHGLMYGRVGPETALSILDADRRGCIYLPNLRGRVSYPAAAQAAEHFLRHQRAEDRLDTYHLIDALEVKPGEWLVQFSEDQLGKILTVHVGVIQTEKRTLESCSQEKNTPVLNYKFHMENE
jgi:hypothetical protein